jgi:hypothetical protein
VVDTLGLPGVHELDPPVRSTEPTRTRTPDPRPRSRR